MTTRRNEKKVQINLKMFNNFYGNNHQQSQYASLFQRNSKLVSSRENAKVALSSEKQLTPSHTGSKQHVQSQSAIKKNVSGLGAKRDSNHSLQPIITTRLVSSRSKISTHIA